MKHSIFDKFPEKIRERFEPAGRNLHIIMKPVISRRESACVSIPAARESGKEKERRIDKRKKERVNHDELITAHRGAVEVERSRRTFRFAYTS